MTNQLPIIFLDIDGVLNHELFFRGLSSPKPRLKDRPYSEIDPNSMDYLNSIIDLTGAKIVISSSWRLFHSVDELREIFKKCGFHKDGEIIGATENLRSEYCFRGNEIFKWIKSNEKLIGVPDHEYKRYVILDDDSDMLFWQKDNYLKVDQYCGLTPTVAWKTGKILNQEKDDLA